MLKKMIPGQKGGAVMYFILYSGLLILYFYVENIITRLSSFQFLNYFITLVNIVWLVSGSIRFYFTIRALILNFLLVYGLLLVFNFCVKERSYQS